VVVGVVAADPALLAPEVRDACVVLGVAKAVVVPVVADGAGAVACMRTA